MRHRGRSLLSMIALSVFETMMTSIVHINKAPQCLTYTVATVAHSSTSLGFVPPIRPPPSLNLEPERNLSDAASVLPPVLTLETARLRIFIVQLIDTAAFKRQLKTELFRRRPTKHVLPLTMHILSAFVTNCVQQRFTNAVCICVCYSVCLCVMYVCLSVL